MNTILRTDVFDKWLRDLRDATARGRIVKRIISAQEGNFGDCKPVGEGVSEMRIDIGPGYRVYFVRSGLAVYVLLAGGDKSTQSKDIKRAIALAKTIRSNLQ